MSTLDQNASYLGRLGENVTDISQLWRFAIQQAMGFNVVPTLASNVDASVPGPGFSLSLGQSYASSILDRNTPGPLGLGWSLDGPWQDTLSTLSDGSVAIQGPGWSLSPVPARQPQQQPLFRLSRATTGR